MKSLRENLHLVIRSRKDTSDIEIGKTVSNSTKSLIPELICWTLIGMSLFSDSNYSDDTNRQEYETNESHPDVDE
jgi:hypothetical protein